MKVRIESLRSGRSVETSALVNSGFEADTPQLLVPRSLAKQLDLWPPPDDAQLVEVGTAGGPTRNYLVPRSLQVSVVTTDRVVGPITADAMISSLEYEVLISDYLGSLLGIVILDLRGKWRFADDSPETVRESVPPEHWY